MAACSPDSTTHQSLGLVAKMAYAYAQGCLDSLWYNNSPGVEEKRLC